MRALKEFFLFMLLQDISKISRENIIVPRNVNAVL